ncbi:MAG: hypothetical protein ACSHX8_08795 [Opitutaceae bacterium]
MKRFNGPLYHLLRRLWNVDAPNPYGTVEFVEPADEPEVPLCLNCLVPEEGHQWICSNCGWPTSFHGSQMSYIDVFCMGALLRSGVDGSVKLTRFRMIGLIIYSIMQYSIFSPLYWYRLSQAKKGNYIQNSTVEDEALEAESES